MISKNLYFQILFRVLVLLAFSILLGWMIFQKEFYILSLIPVLAIIIQTVNLIWFLNSVNRRIFYFFDAIQNEDFTLSFPDKTNNKIVNDLNKSLKKVNKQIQKIQIENRQREQYFQAIMEQVATGIITLNLNGYVLHANTSAKRLLGVEILTHIQQLERVDKSLYKSITSIKSHEQKLVSMATKTGTVELLLKASSFKTQNDELTLLIIQDIRNELDEKELDSWMKLIRVLMHEIMNSIAPITSLSESLTKYFTINNQAVKPSELNERTIDSTIKGLNVIKEQGNGLIKFVDSYRKLTRIPKPEKINFKLIELIDRIKILYNSLENSNNVKLSVSINPPELELFADENLIAQVLINLLKNALEAIGSNTGGKIHIIAEIAENNNPQILICDNGSGIPIEIIEQIFIPFFTTREKGSGIGLSISRQIMRLHKGSLHVRSTPNIETVFTLKF